MTKISLTSTSAALPEVWRSRILGETAGANLKVLRMDGAIPFESHPDFDEALLVIEGRMLLESGGTVHDMGPGDLYIVPAGEPHRVLEGSHGTLFLVDRKDG